MSPLVAHRQPVRLAASVLLTSVVLAACGAPERPLAPDAGSFDASRSTARPESATPTLLACDEVPTSATSGVIGTPGGTLSAGSVRFHVPINAVVAARSFTMTTLAGPHAKVDVHADGLASFNFERPVTVTIDLAHCPDISGSLTVWHMDAATGAFLENMGGVTDLARRTITFQTPHLSIYAVAN